MKYKYENCVFGEWIVLNGLGKGYYEAVCSCGNRKKVYITNLTSGKSTNCGCMQAQKTKERFTTHGMSSTKIYRVWCSMLSRCNNPNVNCYKNYGGRGISVCKEWNAFEIFYQWAIENGYKEGLKIDRIEVDKNYEPSNCRWVTHKENERNKRI